MRAAFGGIALVISCSVVGYVGCDRDQARAPAPVAAQALPASQDVGTARAQPTTRSWPETPTVASRVYVDISGSMNGFTDRNRRSISALHQAIDDALAEVGRGSPKRCVVGEEIDCGAGVPATNLAFDSPDVYHALSSRLDRVLFHRPLPEVINPNSPPPPDNLDDAHVTILVTDGMQVAGPSGESNVTSAASGGCQASADPSCITGILRGRVEDGYGVWLVQQILPFKGKHFAERPISEPFLAQTRAHVEEVKADLRYAGAKFDVKDLKTDERSGTSSFFYEGVKPLLVFVLTRDAELGRRTVATMMHKLRGMPLAPGSMSPEFATQFVELAPLAGPTHALKRVEVAPDNEQAKIALAERMELKLKGSVEKGRDVSADVWCGAKGKSLFYVPVQTNVAKTLPSYVQSKTTLAGPVGNLPSRASIPVESRNEGAAYRIGLNCQAFNTGRWAVGYELRSELSLDREATTGEWWSELSSPDTYQFPDRAYGLRELVLGVLDTRMGSATNEGRLVVSIDHQ